jgi:DNA-binding MarR family transcriptional regulator
MSAWLNLRELLDAVARESELKHLDDRSQRLLEWVVVHHNPKQHTFVQTIINESGVASPATLHKCMSLLEREGFLHFEVDPIDSRRRIVTPTEKSKRLFDKLGRQVNDWAGRMQAKA